MCGRYTLFTPLERLVERFHLSTLVNLVPRYNIAPSQSIPVVRESNRGRELAMLQWGLVPFWAKQVKTSYQMINARAETVATKPAFKNAFRQRRCLIPADGFYEWRASPRGKQPYYISCKDNELLAFAGLWERWEGGAGEVIESCAIIVTAANELIQPIHDRMPVILEPENYALWLDNEHFDVTRLNALLQPYLAERMQTYPVSSRVNSPKNDDQGCVTPL